MKICAILGVHIFTIFLSSPAFSVGTFSTEAPSTAYLSVLPVIRTEDFWIGREWTWDYVNVDGKAYATEQYTVIEREGSQVTFELASTYSLTPFYSLTVPPHHRLRVDIDRCLRAHRNAADPQTWSIELLFWEAKSESWVSAGISSPLAFEEKFNCNPHPQATTWQWGTEYDVKQAVPAFHHLRKTGTQTSWFEISGEDAAVAIEKEFHHRGQLTYRFIRRRPAAGNFAF